MNISLDDWSYEDFITLLYIRVIATDYSISEKENDIIIEKIGKEKYKKNLKQFIRLNDVDVIKLLKKLSTKYYSSLDLKEKIHKSIKEVIHIKGHKSILEENIFRTLKEIL